MTMDFDTRKFVCKPFFKPASLVSPLSFSSAHEPSTRRSWTIKFIRSLRQLCTYYSDFLVARDFVIGRFAEASAPRQFLELLSDVTPKPLVEDRRGQVQNAIWLVLPFHPHYQHAVRRCVGAFNRDFDTRALFTDIFADEAPCVRIAWANRAPNLAQCLRNGWR